MGQIYISGIFKDTCDFDPGPGEDIHQSEWHDNYNSSFSKFDLNGTYLYGYDWNFSKDEVSIYWDSEKFIAAGNFNDTVDFNPDPYIVEEHTCVYSPDAFMMFLY